MKKMKKMKQGSLKLGKETTAVHTKKKRNLSKLTMKEFFEQDLENNRDSDIYDSDETSKNIGMIKNIRICLIL